MSYGSYILFMYISHRILLVTIIYMYCEKVINIQQSKTEVLYMSREKIKRIFALTVAAILSVQAMTMPTEITAYASQETENVEVSITQNCANKWAGYTKISKPDDLFKIQNDLNGKYVLTKDIDITSQTSKGGKWDTGNGWNPIDNFQGILDGNGHCINGMHIYGDNLSYVGFFGYDFSGEVRNLGLTNININCNNAYYIGGVSSWSEGKVEKCYVTGKIKSNNADNYVYAAGISPSGGAEDCFNSANISVTKGMVYGVSPDAEKCYNTGKLEGSGVYMISSSGWNKYNYYVAGSCTSNYESNGAKSLTSVQMKLKNSFVGFDFDKTWIVYKYGKYKYPQLRSCPVDDIRKHTVTFLDGKKVIAKRSVIRGESASAPKAKKKGYTFSGWDKKFSCVKSDIKVKAKWTKVKTKDTNINSIKQYGYYNEATIKYKKVSNAAGYEIKYSTHSNMSNPWIVYSKNEHKTVSDLSYNTEYYFRVRAYKKDSTGAWVYGKWSPKKSIYIKDFY